MFNNIYKKIYKEIKKNNQIVIARHIGADPDALASSFGLKALILNTFPHKKVYVIGAPASKFSYLGKLDKYKDIMQNSLLIVTDTPDRKRVDGVDPLLFAKSIKIDHHPFIEKTCQLEWIDDRASSASQMIMELAFNTKLKMNLKAAELLYIGLVADSNRFMFKDSTPKTFALVSKLIKQTNLDITKEYDKLYMKSYKDIKFLGYIYQNITITENGLAYIVIKNETMKEYEIDAATAGNMVNNLNHINDFVAWVFFSEDVNLEAYRVSIRSRGPIINDIALNFGGGGHKFASGVRLKDEDKISKLINELDNCCRKYNEKIKKS